VVLLDKWCTKAWAISSLGISNVGKYVSCYMDFMGVLTGIGIARTVERKTAVIMSLGCIVGCVPGMMKFRD
jgi:hypothetical protein